MLSKLIRSFICFNVILFSVQNLSGQISPGELSNPHAHLEGISNCTKCHVLGDKVSNEKCLKCHEDIQIRIIYKKGYHSSSEVNGKECIICHSEHNGKKFKLIRLDTLNFNHAPTGYVLSVPHSKKKCSDCHNSKYIEDLKLKFKKGTYLGLGSDCLNCHDDYHMRTLSNICLNCHVPESFIPALNFNHSSANFKLAGKHRVVDCVKCHKVQMVDGRKYQQFKGLTYTNCTSCHNDPHHNQFGQNCRQCHSEESFQIISGLKNFDHNKTNYKLEGKHFIVNCKECHKGKFTEPLKYSRCSDCHSDYHNGQLKTSGGYNPDCSECHSLKGFNLFSFSIDQHNQGAFPLVGSHLAIPCYECHKKQEKWNFRSIGKRCSECHSDIHQGIIPTKYYPDSDCKSCHNENRWNQITFDHSKTEFKLTGGHNKTDCRACHFRSSNEYVGKQVFSGLLKDCGLCHKDNHFTQFEKNGITDCNECHNTENWKASLFDHNKTSFKLDGKHEGLTCNKCHKSQQEGSVIYVKYKIKDFRCESCHS